MDNIYASLQHRFFNAAKWSAVTEIAARVVSPVTNMILARIISPDAFGIIASITMIVSFADMFTDAGFQKYLVQHQFESDKDKYCYANVAFITNLAISIILWITITVARHKIARIVGNPEYGDVLAIASIQLIFTSFSSIQMALFRRDFKFKTLFMVRIVLVFIPFIVTIPLALSGFNHWSLVIGTLVTNMFSAVILTLKSSWKPKLLYNLTVLKRMISFSSWSLFEAVSIWLTAWIDVLIIGNSLNQYYLGLYKTSTSLINALMTLVTASIVPVLFSALSRMQSDKDKFNSLYLSVQRFVALFLLPLGVAIYIYSDLVTQILLGPKWNEASKVIGVWSLTSSILIVFGHFCSEVYRAKGRPKLSLLAQLLHLIILIPVCIYSSQYGFWSLVYARAWIRLEGVLVHFIIMQFSIGISIKNIMKNVLPAVISTIIMSLILYILKSINGSLFWNFASFLIGATSYLGIISLFPQFHEDVHKVLNRINSKDIVLSD